MEVLTSPPCLIIHSCIMENLFIHIFVNRKHTDKYLAQCDTWTNLQQRISCIWCNWNVWINWRLTGTFCWILTFWHALYVCRFCPEEVEMHLIYNLTPSSFMNIWLWMQFIFEQFCYTYCGHVVKDFESKEKTRSNFWFR